LGFSGGISHISLTAIDFFTETFSRVRFPAKFNNNQIFPLDCNDYDVFAQPLDDEDYLILFCYTSETSEIFVTTCTASFNIGNTRGRLHHQFPIGTNYDTGIEPEFFFEPKTSRLLVVRHELDFSFTISVYEASAEELFLHHVLSSLPGLVSEFIYLSPEKTITYFVPSEYDSDLNKLEILDLNVGTRTRLTVESSPAILNEAIENRIYSSIWNGTSFYCFVPLDMYGNVSLFVLELKTRQWKHIILPNTIVLHPDPQNNGSFQLLIDDDSVLTIRWHTRIPSSGAASRHLLYRIPLFQPVTLFCSAYFTCKKHGFPSVLPYTFPIVSCLKAPPNPDKPTRKRKRRDTK